MPTITYQITRLYSAVNGIYRFRVDRIIKEQGKPTRIEEYQLCRTLTEAQNAIKKLEA